VIKESNQVKGTGENGRIVKAISKTLHQLLLSQLLTPVVAKTETVVAPAAQKCSYQTERYSRKKLRIPNAQDHCKTFG
jgi:hypothetical protein